VGVFWSLLSGNVSLSPYGKGTGWYWVVQVRRFGVVRVIGRWGYFVRVLVNTFLYISIHPGVASRFFSAFRWAQGAAAVVRCSVDSAVSMTRYHSSARSVPGRRLTAPPSCVSRDLFLSDSDCINPASVLHIFSEFGDLIVFLLYAYSFCCTQITAVEILFSTIN